MNKLRKLGLEFYIGFAFLMFGLLNLFVIIPSTIRVHYNPLMTSVAVVQNGRVMPSVYTILIILSSLALMLQQISDLRRNAVAPLKPFDWIAFQGEELLSLAYIGITVLFVLIMSLVGLIPAVVICFISLCLLYGYRHYKVIIVAAILLPVTLYFILVKLLYVSL